MKAIVLAGTRGIGEGIARELVDLCDEVVATSSSELDTSDIEQVKKFVAEQKETDVLVLNTGGPPAKDFFEITEEEWHKYYNQLFYSFVYILQNLKVNDGGYIFLVSSHQIKEPDEKMALSVAYRIAFSSVLKILAKQYAARHVNCINLAPGAIGTDRLIQLVGDVSALEEKLPMKRVGKVEELSLFVRSIVEHKIKYLSGVTINFDGANSRYVI